MRLTFLFLFFFCELLFPSYGFYYPVKYEFMAWRIQYRCFREIQSLDFNEILSIEFYVRTVFFFVFVLFCFYFTGLRELFVDKGKGGDTFLHSLNRVV